METVIARINDQSPINHEIKKVKVSLTEIFIQTSGSKWKIRKTEFGRSWKSRIQILPLGFDRSNQFLPTSICQLNRPLE